MLFSLFCCTELWRQLVREKTCPLDYNTAGDKWLLARHVWLNPLCLCCVLVQTSSLRLHLQLLVKSMEMCLMCVQYVRVSVCNACVHIMHICILYIALSPVHFLSDLFCRSVRKCTAMWCRLFVLVVREKARINGFSLREWNMTDITKAFHEKWMNNSWALSRCALLCLIQMGLQKARSWKHMKD